jgi:hypothetical protein
VSSHPVPPFAAARPRFAWVRVLSVAALLAAGVSLEPAGAEADEPASGPEIGARTVMVTPLDRIDIDPASATIADEVTEAMVARFEREAHAPAPPAPEAVTDAVNTAGPTPMATWEAVARCESGYGGEPDWTINTGNGFYGGLQFTLDSWRWVGGSGFPHEASKAEQIARAEVLLERQGWRAWPACSRALGLR